MDAKWSPDNVIALGVRTNLDTANAILGLGRSTGYELARRGQYPVPVLRVGRRFIVPVAGLLDALGIATGGDRDRQLTA